MSVCLPPLGDSYEGLSVDSLCRQISISERVNVRSVETAVSRRMRRPGRGGNRAGTHLLPRPSGVQTAGT